MKNKHRFDHAGTRRTVSSYKKGEKSMQLFRLYQETMNLVKQKFTRGELCMMIDIMNGTYLDPYTLPIAIKASVEDSFNLYPSMYEEKWKTTKDEMLEKQKSLNDFQSACLAIWANDFWYSSDLACPGDLDVYIKTAPAITQSLEDAEKHLDKSIKIMEESKGAFKSAQIAEAREAAQKAKEILENLL